jgi:hypothetical protein
MPNGIALISGPPKIVERAVAKTEVQVFNTIFVDLCSAKLLHFLKYAVFAPGSAFAEAAIDGCGVYFHDSGAWQSKDEHLLHACLTGLDLPSDREGQEGIGFAFSPRRAHDIQSLIVVPIYINFEVYLWAPHPYPMLMLHFDHDEFLTLAHGPGWEGWAQPFWEESIVPSSMAKKG